MVGLREWEGPDRYSTCDVLEVYDQEDINQLRSIPSINIHHLDQFTRTYVDSSASASDELTFSEDASTSLFDTPKQKIPSKSLDECKSHNDDDDDDDEHDDDEIDIDDI